MQRLYGRRILIGRDPDNSRLMVTVNGAQSKGVLNVPVPSSVSRCRPSEHMAHCSIDVDNHGRMTINNMNPMNRTCVNGYQVQALEIDEASQVTLGAENYPINVPQVLNAAKQLLPAKQDPPAPAPTVSLRVVKPVWDAYEENTMLIKKRQRTTGLISKAAPMFTLGSGAIAAFLRMSEQPEWTVYVTAGCSVTGLCLMIYGFVMSFTDKSLENGEKLKKEFQDNYVCPNCGRFLGQMPYDVLKRQLDSCPKCKCKYTF